MIVALGRNVVVLEILLSVESDLLGLDLSVLNFHLISTQNDWNVFTDSGQVTMPVGNIFVSDTGGNIKHDNGALSLDVVPITQSTEFLTREIVLQNAWLG